MRLLLAALIPLILFGGIAAYVEFTERVRPAPIEQQSRLDNAAWSVRLYPTAQLAGDADFDEPSLQVELQGQTIFAELAPINSGQEIRIAPLRNVRSEQNNLFVQATFAESGTSEKRTAGPKALRVQVFRGLQQRADRTFWKPDGRASISGGIDFSAPNTDQHDDQQDAGEHP